MNTRILKAICRKTTRQEPTYTASPPARLPCPFIPHHPLLIHREPLRPPSGHALVDVCQYQRDVLRGHERYGLGGPAADAAAHQDLGALRQRRRRTDLLQEGRVEDETVFGFVHVLDVYGVRDVAGWVGRGGGEKRR